MVYHNLFHRIDGILHTSSYVIASWKLAGGIGANQNRRNILNEKIMVFRVKCADMFFV